MDDEKRELIERLENFTRRDETGRGNRKIARVFLRLIASRGVPRADAPLYMEVLDRLFRSGQRYGSDYLEAGGVVAELRELSESDRFRAIISPKRQHNLALFRRLLDKALELAKSKPAEAVDVALLAVAFVDTLDFTDYPAGLLNDLRASALGMLGNAYRRATEFEEARKAFDLAEWHLEEGSGDPGELPALLSLRASLLRDLGDYQTAALLCRRAARRYRLIRDIPNVARLQVQEADALLYFEPERAAAASERAARLINPAENPRLLLCAVHNRASALALSHQERAAIELLDASRYLYKQFPDSWSQNRLRWLEGFILARMGNPEGGAAILREVWAAFAKQELRLDLVLVSVDLAAAYLRLRAWGPARELLAAVLPLLDKWGMHEEGRRQWLLLLETFRQESATYGELHEAGAFWRRSFFRPFPGSGRP